MDARRGKDKFFIQIESRLACGVDACDARLVEHPWDVVRDGIADGRIGSSRDVADSENVPQGDVPLKDKLHLLFGRHRFRRVEQLRHERPETVLRVGVIEAVLHGLRRRHRAEHKSCGGLAIYWIEGVFAFFCVHNGLEKHAYVANGATPMAPPCKQEFSRICAEIN